MDVDELRRLIRGAMIAAPLAGLACASAPPRTSDRAPEQVRIEAPPREPEVHAIAPVAAGLDPDFDRRWEAWRSRNASSVPTPWPAINPSQQPPPNPLPGRAPPLGFGADGPRIDSQGGVINPGRPLVDAGIAARAPLNAGATWCAKLRIDVPSSARSGEIAAYWLEAATLEHASVASFARATLELMALGGPPELVAWHQRASLDEIEHATQSFAIAAAYGATRAPGSLSIPAPRAPEIDRFAHDVLVEGCVPETASALVAARAARACTAPSVRTVLERIAADEADHAALAWTTLRWALARGARLPAVTAPERIEAPSADAELARHGVLDRDTQRAISAESWARIVEPIVCELAMGADHVRGVRASTA